jgi:hypothetical protein
MLIQKCYIAGAISGLSVPNYTHRFNKAKDEVAALGYQAVSPIELPHQHSQSWQDYMKEDLAELLQCSAVYVLANWQTSRGARVEVYMAKLLGLKLIYQPVNGLNS